MSDNEHPSISPKTREEFLQEMGRIFDEGKVDLENQSFLILFVPREPNKGPQSMLVVGDDSFSTLDHFSMVARWLAQVPPVQEFSQAMRHAMEFVQAQQIAKQRTGLVAASNIHPGLPRA